jgi:hypothetical protein
VVEVLLARGENPRWAVRYTYTVDGREFAGEGRMRRRVPVGSMIPIRYAVHDVSRSWMGTGAKVPIWVSPLLAINFAGGAAAIFFVRRREAYLLREGRAALGRVVDSKQIHKGGGPGAKTAFRLTVEFRLLSGAWQTARFDRRRAVPVGGSVVVVYDRDNPRRSELYPFRLVRLSD